MRKTGSLALTTLILLSFVAMTTLCVAAGESPVRLMIIEYWHGKDWRGDDRVTVNLIPPGDNSMTNPDYTLLPFHWDVMANYWINPSNRYGFSVSAVATTVKTSADTWDRETNKAVFAYKGTTSRSAGRYDGYNVVAWGSYRARAIAVTYIWYSGSCILETDTIMNTVYRWSLNGAAGKMDVQNIMTHEFGHWAGLADLYGDVDYWLTMYGYSSYGETYKRTLGLGDILGLEAVYGP